MTSQDYFQETQLVALVDEQDSIVGSMDKYEAHEKQVLHRALSIAIYYGDQILIQMRRHPMFNGYLDGTIASHQLFKADGSLETGEEACWKTLKRECNILPEHAASELLLKGKIYYQAKDPRSKYGEHEIDWVYELHLKELPELNYEYAYGYLLMPKEDIIRGDTQFAAARAPWLLKMIEEGLV